MMYLDKNITTMQRFFEEYLVMKNDVEKFMEHFEGRIEDAKKSKEHTAG